MLQSDTGDAISGGEARSRESGEGDVIEQDGGERHCDGEEWAATEGMEAEVFEGDPEDIGTVEENNQGPRDEIPKWALTYTIGRNYTSVAQYWKEWAYGKEGCPMSLRKMEQVFGNRWRKGRDNEGKRLSKVQENHKFGRNSFANTE